jgi:hypothetical protein
MQMPTIETRVASLEAVQAQINERLGNIEQELRDIRTDARQNTRWMFGLLVTVLLANIGTAISTIVALSRQ